MFSMTKLRDNSHVLLWILLFFFVASMAVGGLVGGANIMDLIMGGSNTRVHTGSIGGKNITHNRYLAEREIQLNRMRQQGQTIDNRAYQNAGDFAWNNLVDRQLIDEKINSLGLEVSLDEIYDFLLNTSPPAFQTNLMDAGFFKNEDGTFDLESYQQSVQNGTMPVELEPLLVRWENYLRTWLADRKLRTLYNQMGSVNNEDVKKQYVKDSLNCTLDFLYLPFSNISDSLIEVSEQEILERYEENKEDTYALKERRTLEYVLFDLKKPITSDDSLNFVALEDSVMQLALDFVAEADFASFSDALSKFDITSVDTIDVHETFESNSGIPFQLGVLRPAVRFAFDNSIGEISDPMTAQNGIAVFHLLSEKSKGFKSLDEVRANINRTLIRENKIDYAKNLLESVVSSTNDWNDIASSDSLFKFVSGETQKIGGSFTGIGKNNVLTGTLLAMDPGNDSRVLETYNAVVVIKMIERDELDEEKYGEAYDGIRTQLLNTELSRGYTNWISQARKEIEKKDYRSTVY